MNYDRLLWCWVASGFHVLVPKRRSDGYLRAPYGHHPDPGLDRIAALVHVDVVGLDGALYFECGGSVYHGSEAVREAFAAKVVPALEQHYGVSAREIGPGEFWRLHPQFDAGALP